MNKYEKASVGLGVAAAAFPLFAPLFGSLSAGLGAKGLKDRLGDQVKKEAEKLVQVKQDAPAPVATPAPTVNAAPKTYFRGGRVDGKVIKGRTRGRIV